MPTQNLSEKLATQYGESNIPVVGQIHLVKPLKFRAAQEVEILSVTVTDVYIRYLNSRWRSSISHWSFIEWKESATGGHL